MLNDKNASKFKARAIVVGAIFAAMFAMSGCKEKGPLEKAGENIDEVGRTIKNGGEKTTADKVDDKLDKAADKVNDAVKN
ncbi:MAG TPA: hypothetical protein VK629_21905 [Steroidobacteraceae bacterium]|nr:hypothetical protein [Steroidobacteraceae bacterium]